MLLIATPALAQPSFGVKAGLNVADILFSEDQGFDEEGIDDQPRLGFAGGVTADVPFTPTLGVRVEALFAQKGYVIDFDTEILGQPLVGKQTLKLDYLEVPVLANITFPMQSGLEIGVQAGVAPAFLLSDGIGCSGFETEEGSGCDEIEDDAEDEDLGIKSFDLGLAAGATIGAGPFAVDLRYTYGLVNLDDSEISGNDEDFTARNGVFSVTGVYRFGR